MIKSERLARLNELDAASKESLSTGVYKQAELRVIKDDAIALCNEYAAENAKLLALLEECEGVLTYYRRVDNYMAKLADNGRFDFRNTDIHKDGGSRARDFLTKLRAAGIGGK